MRVGHNGADETFWTVSAPPELGSVEFTVIAKANGLEIGGELISWADVEQARDRARPAKEIA